jgi:uncharacterized protein with gpF-like domain
MKVIRQVYANKGVEADYRKRLKNLVNKMNKIVLMWILANAGTKTANQITKELIKFVKKYRKIFGSEGDKIVRKFVKDMEKHATIGMKNAFAEAGLNVRPNISDRVKSAVYFENKGLVSSIPEKYFDGIQTILMMAILYGWTKGDLTKAIKKRYIITERRVRVITSDQTHKTNEIFKRSICEELGVKKARWVYTWRSEKPRENHVEMDGAVYDMDKGCYDYYSDDYIQPAQLYNCKCSFRPIIEEIGDK